MAHLMELLKLSLSARRAWIEIIIVIRTPIGCVVALRKESVDRNRALAWKLTVYPVALRKESVDRNVNLRVVDGSKSSSLSARRAWIEICYMDPVPVNHKSRSPQGERG